MRFGPQIYAAAIMSAFEKKVFAYDVAKLSKVSAIETEPNAQQILNDVGALSMLAGKSATGLACNLFRVRGINDVISGRPNFVDAAAKIASRLSAVDGSGVLDFPTWTLDSALEYVKNAASEGRPFFVHIMETLEALVTSGGGVVIDVVIDAIQESHQNVTEQIAGAQESIQGVGTKLGSQIQADQEKTFEMLEYRFDMLQGLLLDIRENGNPTAPSLVQSNKVNAARLTSKSRKLVMNRMEPEKTVAGKGGTVKKPGPTKNLAAKTQTKSNTSKAKNVEGGAAFTKQKISDWRRRATRGYGDPEASYQLARAHANGWGVSQSDTQAKVYLALASKGGHEIAGRLYRKNELPFAAKVAGPEHATEGRKVLSLVENGASSDGDLPKAVDVKEATFALQGSTGMSVNAPAKAQTEHTASREVARKPSPPAVAPTSKSTTIRAMCAQSASGALQGNSTKHTLPVSNTPSLFELGGMLSALLSPPDAPDVVTMSTPSAAAQSGGNGGTSPCKPHYESKWIKALSERKEHMPIISETPLGPKILFSEADCPASRGTFRREVNDILGNSTRVPTTQTPQKTANSPSVQTPGQNAERLQQVRDMVSQRKLHRSSFEHPVKDGDLLRACKACSPRYSPVRKSPSLRSPLSTSTNR